MNSLIPIEYYTVTFHNVMLIVLLFVLSKAYQSSLDDSQNLKGKTVLGYFLLIFSILYMGMRPISWQHFGDMSTYAAAFEKYASGEKVDVQKDVYFEYFIEFCSKIMDVNTFFVVCAALYILPMYFFSKKYFKNYWFYSFYILVISMSFWAYGVNGIRNGIATSVFLLAITMERKVFKVLLLVLAVSFHKSLILPIAAYLLTLVYTNTKTYLKIWLLSIPVSLVLGGFWEGLFKSFGFFEDERLNTYLTDTDAEVMSQFSNTGFRWDFLLYSLTGIYAGWYFIVKKGYEDKLYSQIFNTYVLANAFWILVIRASFSNRFAYLSWFLLGIVTIYPLLKLKFFQDQHIRVAKILLATFAFTYLMYFLTGVR